MGQFVPEFTQAKNLTNCSSALKDSLGYENPGRFFSGAKVGIHSTCKSRKARASANIAWFLQWGNGEWHGQGYQKRPMIRSFKPMNKISNIKPLSRDSTLRDREKHAYKTTGYAYVWSSQWRLDFTGTCVELCIICTPLYNVASRDMSQWPKILSATWLYSERR